MSLAIEIKCAKAKHIHTDSTGIVKSNFGRSVKAGWSLLNRVNSSQSTPKYVYGIIFIVCAKEIWQTFV